MLQRNLSGFAVILFTSALSAQSPIPQHTTALNLQHGYSAHGEVRENWLAALRYLRRDTQQPVGPFTDKPLSAEESDWAKLIASKVPAWAEMIDSLRVPFADTIPPDSATILLGNQGGEDAFLYRDATMCFDVQRLQHVYGDAAKPTNINRLDRFFAHEFTHILHKAWLKKQHVPLDTPLQVALWDCLTEGIGNYRSLSAKWKTPDGGLSEHAKAILQRLQPIFVERLVALQHASHEEVPVLMDGLSMGPFEQKWGALTVALWLVQEARDDDTRLQKWVDAGPNGVLTLAQKYLPDELKNRLPK